MNPSVDVGRPPRPFRHLRLAERRTPDPSSSRAPVHSALVQKSVTRHHQPGRSAFRLNARGKGWAVARGEGQKDGPQLATKVMPPQKFSLQLLISGFKPWRDRQLGFTALFQDIVQYIR